MNQRGLTLAINVRGAAALGVVAGEAGSLCHPTLRRVLIGHGAAARSVASALRTARILR